MIVSYHSSCYNYVSLGVQNGNFHIVSDLIGNLFRSSTLGATPHNNVFMDAIYGFVGWVRTVLRSSVSDIGSIYIIDRTPSVAAISGRIYYETST